MIAEMRSREHEYFQYKAGLLDEDVWLSYREILSVTLGDERGRRWWKIFRFVGITSAGRTATSNSRAVADR